MSYEYTTPHHLWFITAPDGNGRITIVRLRSPDDEPYLLCFADEQSARKYLEDNSDLAWNPWLVPKELTYQELVSVYAEAVKETKGVVQIEWQDGELVANCKPLIPASWN